MYRWFLVFCALVAAVQAAEPVEDPAFDFAFLEPAPPAPLTPEAAQQILTVPGSKVQYTMAQRRDKFVAVDWFPQDHAKAPDLITRGRAPDVSACGRCHTVTGTGKPENAALAGLNQHYLLRQLLDMRAGKRLHPRPSLQPSAMFATALHLTDQEIEQAAIWFSQQIYRPVLSVKEAAEVPAVRNIGWLWALDDQGQTLKTAGKIIEVARNAHAFEQADLRDGIIAFVAPGTLARGKRIVEQGTTQVPACQTCHGVGLQGSIAPALAARYPNYLLRQLLGFANGRRNGQDAMQMIPIATSLTRDEMIAAVAYAASLTP